MEDKQRIKNRFGWWIGNSRIIWESQTAEKLYPNENIHKKGTMGDVISWNEESYLDLEFGRGTYFKEENCLTGNGDMSWDDFNNINVDILTSSAFVYK